MFACCFRGPPRAGADDDEMPAAAPPATHLKGAAAAPQPPQQRQELEDEGFTILTCVLLVDCRWRLVLGLGTSPFNRPRRVYIHVPPNTHREEELREAVAHTDNTAAAGNSARDRHAAATEQEEEWDCHFTDLAVLTYPKGQPEGDPSKVNEYEFERYLGAGAFWD